jgi:hypothetical protein
MDLQRLTLLPWHAQFCNVCKPKSFIISWQRGNYILALQFTLYIPLLICLYIAKTNILKKSEFSAHSEYLWFTGSLQWIAIVSLKDTRCSLRGTNSIFTYNVSLRHQYTAYHISVFRMRIQQSSVAFHSQDHYQFIDRMSNCTLLLYTDCAQKESTLLQHWLAENTTNHTRLGEDCTHSTIILHIDGPTTSIIFLTPSLLTFPMVHVLPTSRYPTRTSLTYRQDNTKFAVFSAWINNKWFSNSNA